MTDAIPNGYCHCGCGQKTNLAKQSLVKAGWIKGQPLRFIAHHHIRLPAPARFWNKVQKTDTCWIWLAKKTATGYGLFNLGPDGGQTGAHRWAYENSKGPIPDGFQIDHLCKNTSCVNPAHLEAVSPQVNVRRSRIATIIQVGRCRNDLHDVPPGSPRCRECQVARGDKRNAARRRARKG